MAERQISIVVDLPLQTFNNSSLTATMEKTHFEIQSVPLAAGDGSREESSAFGNGKKPKFYKPFVLRTLSLALLLGVTLLLLALIEYACQKLPDTENRGLVGTFNNRTGLMDELIPRQLELTNDGTTTTADDLTNGEITTTSSWTFDPDAPEPPRTSLTTETAVISGSTVLLEFSMTRPPFADGGASREAWLKVGQPRTLNQPKGPTSNEDAKPTPISNPLVPGPNNVVVNPVDQVKPTIPNDIAQPTNTVLQPNDSVNVATPQVTVATFIPIATGLTDSKGHVVQTTLPVAVDSKGSTIVLPTNLISVDATTTFLLPPSKTTTSTKTSSSLVGTVNSSGASNAVNNQEAVVQVFTNREYITGAFVPTVIAVLFAIPFGLIDAKAKEMEPIYQLSTPGGASGTNSLGLNYVGASMFTTPFIAFNRKHWMVFLTSIIGPLSLLTAPLAVESIFISLKGTCNSETDSLQCFPTLSVYKTAARVLEAILASIAFLLALLVYMAYKRRSNVLAEPISLAGVASLMHDQEYLNIVRELPSYGVKEKNLLSLLPPLYYTIDHYQNLDGTWGYGLKVSRDNGAPSAIYTSSNTYANANLRNQLPDENEMHLSAKIDSIWAKLLRLAQVLGFMFLLIGLLALVAYYRFVNTRSTGFGNFMSNQRFGVKFMFTILGVIISQFWAYAREKIHRNEPYHALKTQKAPPKNSILKTPALAPITSIFTSITLLSPLLICLDLSTIFADALIITLSNVPYSSATTFESWKICSYISLAILIFMILTLCMIVFRISRFGDAEAGSEAPVTLLGKSVLVCGSNMLDRFDGLGEMNGRERNKCVKQWGRLYGMGRVRGSDGVARRGIDFREHVNAGI